jgi:hypothetical protein
MQLLGGKKCIFVCLTTKSVQIWHKIELGIFARPLAKAKQVAERDINNTNNINQQQLRVQQHSTRSKDLLADGTARLDW